MDIQPVVTTANSASSEHLRTLIDQVARALVDESDQVAVREISGSTTTVYEVSVSKPDVGKIIGKSGRTLRAFRTIIAAVATKYGRKAIVEVLE